MTKHNYPPTRKHTGDRPNAGRPPSLTGPSVLKQFNILISQSKWLDVQAIKQGKSRSELVRDALDFYKNERDTI